MRIRLHSMTAAAVWGVLALLAAPARAASFTVSSGTTDTSAKTLGTASGQTGTVQATGTLSISGSTVAVTISGNNETLTNSGTITQTGTGRVVRDNTGVTGLIVTNNAGALMQSADADVIQMNKSPASVTLNNYGTMTSLNASKGGAQAVDFNAIQSGGNIVNNYATGILQARDADAVRPGVGGFVHNYGVIKATNTTDTGDDGVDAQNNTGVTVHNYATGSIEGARHGITGGAASNAVDFTTTVTNDSGGVIRGNNGSGINLDGFNARQTATIVNAGTITGNGVTGDGDGIDVDGVINLTNGGTIKSLNAFSATVPAQSEGVTIGGGTIVNSGTIEGDVAVGNTNAVGRGITIAGVDTSGTPEPIYANTTIANTGLIRGQTDSAIAVGGGASGFTVTIDNRDGGVIEGAGAAAATIQTGADNDTVINAGSIINDGGASKTAVSLGGGDDHMVIAGAHAVVTGGIDGGTGTNTLTVDLGAPGDSFNHGGSIANFTRVEILSGRVSLNGQNTYAGVTAVGGGTIGASLAVNGRHDGGGAYLITSNGTLGGTGSVSLADASTMITIANGGTLHVGGGRLTIEKGSMTGNGLFSFDINGLAAGAADGYDQLRFAAGNDGTLVLGSGSTLQLNLGFVPAIGEQFELIDLANAGKCVTGTFASLADGAVFTAGGSTFQITYFGGTGNDVVVTAIPEPSAAAVAMGLAVLCGVAGASRRRRVFRQA